MNIPSIESLYATIEQQQRVIKQAHEDIAKLTAEVSRQKDCIRGLTDQCAALVVEKNSLLMDHGGALCDQAKIEMLEAMLAGDDALITGLKNDVSDLKSALREAKKALVMNIVGTGGRTPAAHNAIATINKVLGEE